jgi:hypothetical protein
MAENGENALAKGGVMAAAMAQPKSLAISWRGMAKAPKAISGISVWRWHMKMK